MQLRIFIFCPDFNRNIYPELARTKGLTCIYCNKDGASIKCRIKLCQKRCHFLCGNSRFLTATASASANANATATLPQRISPHPSLQTVSKPLPQYGAANYCKLQSESAKSTNYLRYLTVLQSRNQARVMSNCCCRYEV